MTLRKDLKKAVVSVTSNKNTDIRAEFCFKNDALLFKGHFPDLAILPGIMQLEMVRYGVERATGYNYEIKSIRKTKFTGQILPNDSIIIDISLTKEEDELTLKALLKTKDKTVGKANLTLALRQQTYPSKT